jgi:hypothetical protein
MTKTMVTRSSRSMCPRLRGQIDRRLLAFVQGRRRYRGGKWEYQEEGGSFTKLRWSLRVSFAKLRAGTCVSYAFNLGEFRLISRLVFGAPDHISQLVGPKCCLVASSCIPYPTVALKLYSTASVYGNIIVDTNWR